MQNDDEELHIEIEDPKVSFAIIDAWCFQSLESWGFMGDGHCRTYYFKRKQDVLMFRLRWL